MSWRRYKIYLNNCRNLNLTTGKNCHFNVLEDWTAEATLTVATCDDGRTRLIGGWGTMEEGETVDLYAASGRYLTAATIGKGFPCDAAGLEALRNHLGKGSVPFSTLD